MERYFDDPQYKNWRKAVYKRDNYKCLECGSKRSIQAHHIKGWAVCPELRFELSNGITLCRKCHQKIWGKEESYELRCVQLLNKETTFNINYKLRQMRKEEEGG